MISMPILFCSTLDDKGLVNDKNSLDSGAYRKKDALQQEFKGKHSKERGALRSEVGFLDNIAGLEYFDIAF